MLMRRRRGNKPRYACVVVRELCVVESGRDGTIEEQNHKKKYFLTPGSCCLLLDSSNEVLVCLSLHAAQKPSQDLTTVLPPTPHPNRRTENERIGRRETSVHAPRTRPSNDHPPPSPLQPLLL